MPDVVERFRAASEAGDVATLVSLLEPDAELVSPLSGRLVFRGRDDLQILLTAIYGSMSRLRWIDETGDSRLRMLRGDARVGPFELGDAMVIELSERGRIARIRPHLRPWLGLTALAVVLVSKLARTPGVLIRASRRSA